MRRLFYAAFAYMIVGVASGLFYREFTKINDFPEGESTQLGLVHTHLLVLGFVVLLIVLLLEKAFALSESRLFGWFFWLYNAGLVLTSAMMLWHGSLTVLGLESSSMIAGIAGMGHILLSAGMVLLFLALRKRLFVVKPAAPAAPASAVTASV
jgi:nitric oxide reductase large subunit